LDGPSKALESTFGKIGMTDTVKDSRRGHVVVLHGVVSDQGMYSTEDVRLMLDEGSLSPCAIPNQHLAHGDRPDRWR
jgi:hypothetical protein